MAHEVQLLYKGLKIMRIYDILLGAVIALTFQASAIAADKGAIETVKQERNLINEGNKLYNQQRYSEAEVLYRKALELKPNSEFATYNLATSLIRQTGTKDLNNGNNPLQEAQSLLQGLLESAQSDLIVEKASYNLGNIAFNNNDFKQSIEYYKNALRKNPDNEQARTNLRLAQKKQQQQQQNQDKNQDQQNKDQNKDQQNKDQDKKNQDKNKDQNQDQDKQKQNQDQQNKNQNQPPQEQPGISDANAQKILKAMENEEAATRKRIEAQRKKGENSRRRQPVKPW